MKLTSREQDKLRAIARGTKGTFLIEYLEKIKSVVADVRTPLTNVRPEVEREVRIGICDVIDELLIQKFKVLADEITPPEDNFN